MKILVVGSEGFIGGHVVSWFQEKEQVYKADIVIKEEPNYQVINPEVADFAALFKEHQFDVCINCTGAANVQFSFNHPALDYTLNVANVFYILDALRLYNPHCRFINFSSAAVYGNPPQLPVTEDTPLNPLSPYGWHKLYSEQLCNEFAASFGLKTSSLRVFSAFGEGLKKQLFWDTYKKIVNTTGNSIQLFGSGKESRDFIYITDLARAIDAVIHNASFNGEALNVASGEEVSIHHAVTSLVSLIKPGMQVEFTGVEKKGDPANWKADISKLRNLGFSPKYSFEAGLKNTAAWLKTVN